jgi:pimeloyl-ACP methyl ester carboxylesterase
MKIRLNKKFMVSLISLLFIGYLISSTFLYTANANDDTAQNIIERSWSSSDVLDSVTYPSSFQDTAISVGSDGVWHVVYVKLQNSGDNTIYTIMYVDNFTNPTPLVQATYYHGSSYYGAGVALPDISAGIDGSLYVTYVYSNPYASYLCKMSKPPMPIPIVLVHGWHGDEDSWAGIAPWLKSNGYEVNIFNYDSSSAAENVATKLSIYIRAILDPNNDGINEYSKVDIIAHSFGGLVSRYYIEQEGGDKYVRNLIMLGTPNHGSPLADLITGISDRQPSVELKILVTLYSSDSDRNSLSTLQLRTIPYNLFLANLNSHFHTGQTDYFTIAGFEHFWPSSAFIQGEDDGIVPLESVKLPGVPNYCVKLTHTTLANPSSDAVKSILLSILNGAPVSPSLFPEPIGSDHTNYTIVVPLSHYSGLMRTGDTILREYRSDGGANAIFLTYTNCTFNLTLTSPSGKVITPNTGQTESNIVFDETDHAMYYVINNSESGTWHYTITALETPEDGTNVDLNVIGNSLSPDVSNLPCIEIKVQSPVNILVITADWRKICYDSNSYTVVNEIDGATYTGPNTEPQIITLPSSYVGALTVQLYGTDTGPFTLNTVSYAASGDALGFQTFTGTTTPTQLQSTTVTVGIDGSISGMSLFVTPEFSFAPLAFAACFLAFITHKIQKREKRIQQ